MDRNEQNHDQEQEQAGDLQSKGLSAAYLKGKPDHFGTQNSRLTFYLKARIKFLTTILIRQFGDILEVAMTPANAEHDPPSAAEIANQQLTVDSASHAMIRAAEELMVLNRTMKELWLFGDLDTLVADESPEEREKARQMRADEAAVVQGLQDWLKKNAHTLSKTTTEQEDTTMSND